MGTSKTKHLSCHIACLLTLATSGMVCGQSYPQQYRAQQYRAQQQHPAQRTSAQQAYYQPLTQQQYQQHKTVAYQESFGGSRTNDVAPGPPSSMSLQQRANQLLQRASQSPVPRRAGSYGNNAPFPPRVRAGSAGYRRLQDQQSDPFGDPVPGAQGGNQTKPSNQFDPFADPPSAQPQRNDPFADPTPNPNLQRTPNVAPQDPFGDPPKQTNPFGDPTPNPNMQTPNVAPRDPFGDPPKQDDPFNPAPNLQGAPNVAPRDPSPRMPSQGRDPILPDDAQFTPENLNAPRQTVPPKTDPPQQEQPPEQEEPGQIPENPFKDPNSDQTPDPLLPPDYIPPSGIYKPPADRNLPPIVQPGMVAPPTGMAPRTYPRTVPRQNYQPAYQPIPGAAPNPQQGYAQPNYAQPGFGQPEYAQPPQPGYSQPRQPQPGQPQPRQPQPGYAQPLYAGPTAPNAPAAAPANNDVYNPVVGNNNSNRNACFDSGCPNFYFSLFGGGSFLRDVSSETGGLDTDDGGTFGAALGRRNGRNLRSEIEFTYRQNDITGFSSDSLFTPLEGDIDSFSGMGNAYWEFIDVPTRFLKPYIGAGIGFVIFDADVQTPGGPSIVPTGAANETSFAFQYMAGVNYKAYRNVDLYAEYRFFEAESFRVEASDFTGNYDYESDNVLFGFRWKF